MCYVYAIGKNEDLKDPYDRCYIGVTINLQKRWEVHTKSKYTIGWVLQESKL